MAAGFWGLSLRYLKAPATLVGGAVSQALYPQLAAHGASVDHDADAHAPLRVTREGRAAVRRVMAGLAAIAAPLVLLLWAFGPWAFERLFGPQWRGAGELARALAALHRRALRRRPAGRRHAGLGRAGLGAAAGAGRPGRVRRRAGRRACKLGGLQGAGWGVSIAMMLYFGYYFVRLATWPLTEKEPHDDANHVEPPAPPSGCAAGSGSRCSASSRAAGCCRTRASPAPA